LNPHARWGAASAWLYDSAVAAGQQDLYDDLLAPVREAGVRGRVLDVGAGPGHAAVLLARAHPQATFTGVDHSPSMASRAARRARESGAANVTFIEADALALPFAEASFDLVYSLASIKHWPDRALGLSEIHRVLRPGGAAVVIEADRSPTDAALDGHARRWPWIPPALFRAAFRRVVARPGLDLEQARSLAEASPFGRGTVTRMDGIPFVLIRLIKPVTAPRGPGDRS
jgi:ubiquinone/menaquinone biosynthesis C-methylase UbiE